MLPETLPMRHGTSSAVGGGDAFVAGFIYAYFRNYKPDELVEFAVATSVMKHTINGDINTSVTERDIRAIMGAKFDINRLSFTSRGGNFYANPGGLKMTA